MKRFLSLTLCLSLVVFAGSALAAAQSDSPARDFSEYEIAVPGEGVVLHSSASNSSLRFKEAAGPDTFALYGYVDGYTNTTAPDEDEGRFQTSGFIPDELNQNGANGWISVDLTDNPVFWQISDFNAENLNGNGAGNLAAWCGQTVAQQPGWSDAPGYGNGWTDILRFKETVSNTAAGQTVALDFYFNHDTEPGYDYFNVEYDSAGSMVTLLSVDSSNKDASNIFQAPGVQYSTTPAGDIVYVGNDYGGDNNDEVVIELSVTSDGAWSDEDGLWPTDGGAAQVDDITVTTAEGTTFEDFQSGSFTAPWIPAKAPFHGDFAKVRPKLGDIDPCSENETPLVTFIDAGQTVVNSASAALIPGYPTSTGGETSLNWNYGIPGGWVLNYNGGLSAGQVAMSNEIWSPEISWDTDPNVVDASDDIDVAGARIRFDVWQHLPLANGLFFLWSVRSSDDDGASWTSWANRNFVYYGGGVSLWNAVDVNVTDLLLNTPTDVQMSIGAVDIAGPFGLPGNDATPSPAFDNTGFYKHRVAGPAHSTRQIDLANDGFPVSGSIDAAGNKGALDIPFDMSRDVAVGDDPANDPGDSIIVDILAVIPGTSIADMRMHWVLDKNTFFDDVRSAPNRAKDVNVVTGATQWSGEVLHDTSTTTAGAIIQDRFFFDLPDVDFLQPGDVLRYYIASTDDAGNTSTFPANTTGFTTGEGYNRGFTVRGLPSITDAAGTQPSKLIYNDFGRRGGENDFLNAMGQLGFVEGVDYDTYTTNGPSSGVSNGIGSAGAHGANADQLANYDTIVYFTGNLSSNIMSDGTDGGTGLDKSDDLGVLTAWHNLAGPRYMVHFGDNLFSGMTAETPAGGTYVTTILGADLQDADVRDDIDGQTAPLVRPIDPGFVTEFVAFGGCLGLNQFDRVEPLAAASRGHGFVDGSNAIYPNTAASIIHDRLVPDPGGDRKVDISFPFGFIYVYSPNAKAAGNEGARTTLLREIFDYFGVPSGGGNVVSAPAAKAIEMAVYPNPFNPTTTVKFANLPKQANGSVKVFNLRGELVSTLHAGEFGEKSQFVWNGTDNNGASVASGVYMIEGQADGFRQVIKVALVK